MPIQSNLINPFLHNNFTQLAKAYKMKPEKFSRLIHPIWHKIKPDDPYRVTLTCKEVWIIVEYLGPPDPIGSIDPLHYNTISRLAELYRVERKTFSRWLKPIEHKIRQDSRFRTLLPGEVRIIVEFLGEPG